MSRREKRRRKPPGAPLHDRQFPGDEFEASRIAGTEEQAGPRGVSESPAVSSTTSITGMAEAVPEQASLWSDAWRQLRRNPIFYIPMILLAIFTAFAIAPGLFAHHDPRECFLENSLQRPQAGHPFGYDLQGCDYFARVIYGTRVSLVVGLYGVFLATTVAVLLGCIAGYYGGVWDALLARLTDIWFAIPVILGAIVVLTVFPTRGVFVVGFVLAILVWPTMMRLMRSSVLSAKEMDYVQAARALGASDFRILTRHILPNGIAPVIVYATITVGILIAAEATLSFLGVGLQLPAISWGLMISGAQARVLQAPHLLLFPATFLSVLVFTFILLGDALRDALDPRLR